MPAILQPLGAMTALLALWLMLCGARNDFLFVLFAAALALLDTAHMVHMGRTGRRLVDAEFQAWDYGPVEPGLYRQVRIFGNRPIQDIFFGAAPITHGGSEASTLDEACEHLILKSPGELVAMTHWQNGAWAKHYVPGEKSIAIPDADIIAEYNARVHHAAQ